MTDGSFHFQLLIENAEFEENDDGMRTFVDGDVAGIEFVTEDVDE